MQLRYSPMRLPLSLLLCSGLATMLILGRILATGQIRYLFLVFNLFLAWVPLVAAHLLRAYRNGRPRWWGSLGLGALWLAFFPNAPYIITDFVHLTNNFDGVPVQFDIALLALTAITGLILGFASLEIVQSLIPSDWLGWLFTLGALLLSSVGIYIGRVERWNSWDLLWAPWSIQRDILAIPERPEAVALVGSFALILPALYLVYRSIRRS